MARRAGLPHDIRTELPTRANAGIGHDPEFPTTTANGAVCKAVAACRHQPSRDMLLFVKQIVDHLHHHRATHVRVQQDFRDRGYPGSLLVAWGSGPSAAEVATQFAVSISSCGTPRLPAWLSLRVDTDFDLRWQPAY